MTPLVPMAGHSINLCQAVHPSARSYVTTARRQRGHDAAKGAKAHGFVTTHNASDGAQPKPKQYGLGGGGGMDGVRM